MGVGVVGLVLFLLAAVPMRFFAKWTSRAPKPHTPQSRHYFWFRRP